MATNNPSQRIKGQEVAILLTRDNNLEDTLTDIMNFNLEYEYEVKSQGYLGEKGERKDFILKGVKFDLELHVHTQDYIPFAEAVRKKATREAPDVIFNITAVLSFPNGETPTYTIPDVVFGPMPLNIGGRGEYVKIKIEGEAETAVPVAS